MELTRLKINLEKIQSQVETYFVQNQSKVLEAILVAYFSRGHVLIEGPPGTGKTMLAKLLSRILSKEFKRIQFTSDLLPGDIIGSHIYNQGKNAFEFIPGPIFSDFVLADEINRTPPRTQSALLEAMEERQVTSEGHIKALSSSFFVIATQNPQEFEGTFPLPEAQLDRFFLKIKFDHADIEDTKKLLSLHNENKLPVSYEDLESLSIEREEIEKEIDSLEVSEALIGYISELILKTRQTENILNGASIRAGINLLKGAKIKALLKGRTTILPEDIKELFLPILRHRIQLTPESYMSGDSEDQVLMRILESTEFPQ